MTTTSIPTPLATVDRTEGHLRRVLVADAASSAAAALAGLALAAPVGRLLDVPTAAVVVVAAAFVPWAVALASLSRRPRAALLRGTPVVAAGNAAYVAASAAVLAAGVDDRSGWWLVVPMAVAVADLGGAQWWLWRTLARGAARPAAVAAAA